jgi:hypothetical protein
MNRSNGRAGERGGAVWLSLSPKEGQKPGQVTKENRGYRYLFLGEHRL